MGPYDALVLDAGLRQSLVAVRSLGRRGLAVGALETSAGAPAFSSRWCRHHSVCPAELDTAAYLEYLDRWLDGIGATVLIPSHDGTIELCRRHRAEIERRAHVALPSECALRVAVSKERTLAVAARLGLPVPRSVAIRGTNDVDAALAEVGLPAVVKPSESWIWNGHGRGRRVSPLLVTCADEARRAVAELTPPGHTTLLQRFLTGRREAVSFLYAGGQVYARFAQWAQRTGPPLGGESILRQSIEVPADSGRQAESLIRALDLEGYSEVEFRRDGDGVPYLMEINPRLSASVEIAVRCGVDFPYLLFQWASGRPIDRVDRFQTGVWMRYLKGDITATIASLRQRGRPGIDSPLNVMLDFGRAFFRPMAYDYLDWHDPLPAVIATIGFTRSTMTALFHGRSTT